MLVLLYLAAVVAANLLTATFGPGISVLNAFVLIGLDLTTRDRLHERWHGSRLWLKMAALIACGSLISWAINRDAAQIALASAVAFALAGATDTLVFHLLRGRSWLRRSNGSNIASAAVDSVAFPTLAFGALLPWVVLGQFAAKVGGGALWSLVLRRKRAPAAHD